jgi:hypothetical protein
MTGVDIIGDIHGHADALERLLDAATSYETASTIIPCTPSSSSATLSIVDRDSAMCSA